MGGREKRQFEREKSGGDGKVVVVSALKSLSFLVRRRSHSIAL